MNTRHTLAAVLVALLLAACGGGGDFEDDGRAVPGPVDCKANPLVCA